MPADGSAPRRKAFELKEIYGCDMLKPTECAILPLISSHQAIPCNVRQSSSSPSDASSACPRRATPLFYRAAIFAYARSASARPSSMFFTRHTRHTRPPTSLQDCAIEMQTSSHKCPMCRQPVESLLTISISRDAMVGASGGEEARLDMPVAP